MQLSTQLEQGGPGTGSARPDARLVPGVDAGPDVAALLALGWDAFGDILSHMRNVTRWMDDADGATDVVWAVPEQAAASLSHIGMTVGQLDAISHLLRFLGSVLQPMPRDIETFGDAVAQLRKAALAPLNSPLEVQIQSECCLRMPATDALAYAAAVFLLAKTLGSEGLGGGKLQARPDEAGVALSLDIPDCEIDLSDLETTLDLKHPAGVPPLLQLALGTCWVLLAKYRGTLDVSGDDKGVRIDITLAGY